MQTWAGLNGLMYDHGLDDILLANPDGRVVFVDSAGNAYSGDEERLWQSLRHIYLDAQALFYASHPQSVQPFLAISLFELRTLAYQALGRQRGAALLRQLVGVIPRPAPKHLLSAA